MSIHIQLEKFEGPMGLLLYLIRKEEMDILDINVHHITQQYLEYIKEMKKLDLEVAGDFVAMAATLIQIKSKLLLPNYNEDGEEIEAAEDPRKELVQKLLEYEMYQEASKQLYDRPLVGRDVFLRGRREDVTIEDDGEVEVEENPLFSLIRAYRTAIKSMKKAVHKVGMELQSIAERVAEMRSRLVIGETVVFKNLITATENVSNQILISFLSFLELGKLGYVSLYQSEPLSDIYIKTLRDVGDKVVEAGDAYSYVTEENILENKGAKIEVDLTADDIEDEDPAVDQSVSLAESTLDDDASYDDDNSIESGDGVEEFIGSPSSSEEEFIVEAATDEEIEEELRKINNNELS